MNSKLQSILKNSKPTHEVVANVHTGVKAKWFSIDESNALDIVKEFGKTEIKKPKANMESYTSIDLALEGAVFRYIDDNYKVVIFDK